MVTTTILSSISTRPGKLFIIGVTILLFNLTYCSPQVLQVSLEGTLVKAGITSYQYGSHQLISKDSLYALRSSTLQLEEFVNKKVNVSGQLVSGYPLEGGPVLIEVSDVKLITTVD